jgi:hypothetical protein
MTQDYVGSGPYCYANSLAMLLGAESPVPQVIEVLTGSPFGFNYEEGGMPLFDPAGWDPWGGVDDAVGLLGWASDVGHARDDAEAVQWLRAATEEHPIFVGPLEMGLLLHQPGSGRATGSDHYVAVLGVHGDRVVFHDPHGHPYATLPVNAFLEAWRASSIDYVDRPFGMRSDFRHVTQVDAATAVRRALPRARKWLTSLDVDGTPATAAALDRFAAVIDRGLDEGTRAHLTYFAVRAGARRLADAASALRLIGNPHGAAIAARQAELVGSLQYDLMVDDRAGVLATIGRVAPMYADLAAAL